MKHWRFAILLGCFCVVSTVQAGVVTRYTSGGNVAATGDNLYAVMTTAGESLFLKITTVHFPVAAEPLIYGLETVSRFQACGGGNGSNAVTFSGNGTYSFGGGSTG